MLRNKRRRARISGALCALLAGGSTLSACQTRVKEAAVAGATNFILFQALSPDTVLSALGIAATDAPP